MELFAPIASRKLTCKSLASEKVTQQITLAVSAPYSPPRDKSVQVNSGCMVLIGEDPELAHEVWGNDELEALEIAIAHIQVFLREATKDATVELRAEDGSKYDPDGPSFLKKYRDATDHTSKTP